MRLTFPNGEHPDLRLVEGEISIGSATGNRVAIDGAGLVAHHARIVADRRGAWLHVSPQAPAAHVNARPVRELAMLRKGDVVCLGHLKLVLSAEGGEAPTGVIPASPPGGETGASSPRVVLRGVAGPHFGRSYPVADMLLIGRAEQAQVRLDNPAVAERHARIELHGDRVVLRRVGGDGVTVNGIRVGDCLLSPGDQLVIEPDRFVLEAPGLAGRPAAADFAQMAGAQRASASIISNEPDEDGASRGIAIWWLIASAAVLAAVITALLI